MKVLSFLLAFLLFFSGTFVLASDEAITEEGDETVYTSPSTDDSSEEPESESEGY